jgi:cyclic-di-GMP phosphodiesterase TipF (flagellum assembly factor)
MIVTGAIAALLTLSALIYTEDLTLREGAAAALVVLAIALLAVSLGSRAQPAQTAPRDVAARLLHVESRLSALDHPPSDGAPQEIADISADVGLLSGLVKSLAEAMAAQEQEIAQLKAKLARLAGPASERAAQRVARENTVEHAAPGLAPAAAPARPALSAIPDRPLRPQPAAEPAPSMAAANRVVPSLLPAEDIAGLPPRSRFDPDPAAFEAKRAAIIEALDQERVELHLQPIVSLPQRRTRLYEVLARLRLADETLLSPAEFMPTLERLGRLPRMDEIVVARALAIATHVATRDSEVRISCNLTPASLRDAALLGKIEAMLALPGILPSRLVFEIQQRSWRTLPAGAAASIERLRAMGVSFALDRATDLRFDGIELGENGISVVKIPADMLLGANHTGERGTIAAELMASLARQGVQVVAERIEREGDVPDLLDLDVPLAQGFALGAPRAVRADFSVPRIAPPLATAASAPTAGPAPAAVPLGSASSGQPAEERVPFRAFLRRTG